MVQSGGGSLMHRGFHYLSHHCHMVTAKYVRRMHLQCTCTSVLLPNNTQMRLIIIAPLLWLTITSTSHTPHIHTCTPHTPTAPLLPQANHAYQLANVKTTLSGTDQTGGYILQHVALSFVWRDPAVVSDCMQRAKAHINSLVTFVVVPRSV